MASRPSTTFKKRQKEIERAEKQRDKAAQRLERKKEDRVPEDDMMTLEEATALRSL